MNRQTYFIDQLCMIGIAGAYAAVMLVLYAQEIMQKLLTGWIQVMVLVGSGILLVLVLVRAIALWQAAGQPLSDEEHEHAHAHGLEHSHAHDHHGDHGHDHGWSPWRYAVLLLPVMVFLLFGSDLKGWIDDYVQRRFPKTDIQGFESWNETPEALVASQVVAMLQGPVGGLVPVAESGGWQLAAVEVLEAKASTGKVDAVVDMARVDQLPAQAELWKSYRRVEVEGMFNPLMRQGKVDGRLFQVVRLRVACCLNDARPASLVVVSRQPVNFRPGEWLTVRGRMEFRSSGGKLVPVLRASRAADVQPTKPPPYPYLN